ncbi:HAMP domain-containing sensor histidine kinase [Micromonospora matsumotoense]|uniref:sensor histidine kinase n=1 Tax=Micromonospora matsumotoense TaxID=121616 RepID=UPI0033DE50C7
MAERRRRDSLLVRLLAVSVVVSVLSITATAWLAVRDTTRTIARERGQALADDAKIYDALLGYAATHRSWADVSPLLDSLATSTGRRIVVTDRDRTPLAASTAGPLPERASATVDPLGVDTTLAGAVPTDGVDPRAVGPFRLPDAERAALRADAESARSCLTGLAVSEEQSTVVPRRQRTVPYVSQDRPVGEVDIDTTPSGRPHIVAPGADPGLFPRCQVALDRLARPTATERTALKQLDGLVNDCLRRQLLPPIRVGLHGVWTPLGPTGVTRDYREAVNDCLSTARRDQLARYVAPPALLFVTHPGAREPVGGFDLSPANRLRIFGVAGLVLLVAVGVTVLVGMRLVRPLHALTAAADRMREGDTTARVEVDGRDEIARLGDAFNAMAEQRRHVEMLRRATVGDVAHEMRTPVTNIRGWLEAAEDGVVALDRELVSSLLEEAMLLQHVIDDLQDLSAADAGELRLYPQRVDLPELLHTVADAFAPAAEHAGVVLAVATPPGTLTADPIRLRQAVGNLLTNAIRHTPAGGRVTLASRTEGDWVVVTVSDTGPGIPQDERALVFERFWRAEKSRSRQTGGSGLGLAIVRKIAEAHGGTATVSGAPGSGAVFTVRLPHVHDRSTNDHQQ